ncbi:hypothetical protein GCM10011515_00080 [Tsuneonella deserti]|uniref:Uncharacterized protein n=1 Tax=Tsuneonella deserti TaxID=2035528 RepID=A0ABQ1RZA0_9SPHN|nr:hypothetical protein [Tsuneonella deserti]GGD84314.1 hypothetical protein GCM10011515_00080 [Tsuneonella deserti]
MKDWKSMIHWCFGLEDREFAQHPSDEQNAFELLTELRSRAVSWPTFERELRKQLGGMPKLDTEAEVRRVHGYFGPWLLD